MTADRILFLDLEDTVITPVINGWLNTQLINTTKIRRVLDEFQPTAIHLFSFAIWNAFELNGFNLSTRPMIESKYNIKISDVPLVDTDIIPTCCRVRGLSADRVDFMDASAFWSKHESFRLFVRGSLSNTPNGTEVMLLDDAVIDEDFCFPSLNLCGKIRNIDNLPT